MSKLPGGGQPAAEPSVTEPAQMSDNELFAAEYAASCSDDGYGPRLRALRTEKMRRLTPSLSTPTIFEYSTKTHRRTLIAKAMRKGLGMTLPDLANMIGYSPARVLAFERGYDKNGKALSDKKWRRYLWTLIGVSYGQGRWEGSQGHARVQAWHIAQGDGQEGQEGRQGDRPQASYRHSPE